ncbi:MAG: CaiB/BaiF CoA-transferase family protein [Actinomycetota bacterium]
MREVLSGRLVVDLSVTAPGPYCTSLLARMGARVVKFEPPEGDPARRFPTVHDALNRGKESVVVDLDRPEDVAMVRRAAARADVFVEGWRPGVAERRGLGATELLAGNPALVYCSISGYGAEGPLRDRPGHDVNFVAASGLATAMFRHREPQALGAPLADLAGGTFGALCVLGALIEATTTGRGRHLEVSLAGSLRDWVDAMGGAATLSTPSILDTVPHYGVFRTRDGHHLSLGSVYEDDFWRELCGVLGLDEHAALGFEERLGRADLRALIEERIGTRFRPDLERDLSSAATCWAFVDPPRPGDGILPILPEHPDLPPALGEHTDAVRAELSS